MNISPNDDVEASQAPAFMGVSGLGELPGRMVGSSGGKHPSDVSGDLKKAPPGSKASSSRKTLDLKMPSAADSAAAKRKRKDKLNVEEDDPLDDEDSDEVEDEEEPDDDDFDDVAELEDTVDADQSASSLTSAMKKSDPSAASSGKSPSLSKTPKKRRARKKWKKPKDKPSRPLSAYNLFFRKERAELLGDYTPPDLDKGQKRVHRKTHGKIGFADMAKIIGAKWKELPEEDKKEFEDVATQERKRYTKELAAWKELEKKKAIEAKKNKQAAKLRAKQEQQLMSARGGGDEDFSREAGGSGFLQNEMMLRQQEEQHWMRMHMMGIQGGFPFAGMGTSQRPTPAIDYLRALQDDRGTNPSFGRMGSALGSMGGVLNNSGIVGGGISNQYPNASENTASALLNQFGGTGGGAMDLSGRSVSDLDRLQQMQMARMQSMQMMNASMMGGPMSFMGSPMSGAMGFGSSHMGGSGASVPSAGSFSSQQQQQQQQFEQLHQMRMMNQLQGGISGGSGSTGDSMDMSLRRMQNRFHGGGGGPDAEK